MVLTPDNVQSFAGLKIQTVSSVRFGTFLGIYGTGGSGKTTECGKIVLSEYGTPALMVDVEGGSSSVVHLIDKGLDIVNVSKWQEIRSILQQLKGSNHKYKSVIWDNLSEIQMLCVRSRAPSGMPEGSDALKIWGQTTADMMTFVRDIRELAIFNNMNVLTVLWEETEKEELTGRVRNKVNLTPKFGAAFPGMVTMVGRLSVPEGSPDYIRKLSFAPSEKTDAKFRVAPTDAAAQIPLELYLRKDSQFLVDFLATVREGKKFPVEKYAAPTRTVQR